MGEYTSDSSKIITNIWI